MAIGLRAAAQLTVLSCVASQPLWFIRRPHRRMGSLSGSERHLVQWEVCWVSEVGDIYQESEILLSGDVTESVQAAQ